MKKNLILALTVLTHLTLALPAWAGTDVHLQDFRNGGKVTSIVGSQLRAAGFKLVGKGSADVIVSGQVIEKGEKINIVAKVIGLKSKKTFGESISAPSSELESAAENISQKIIHIIQSYD